MLLPLSWLQDYFPKLEHPIDAYALAELLTKRGISVPHVRQHAPFSGVVVGRIEKVEKHPQADRLSLVQVCIDKREAAPLLSIVCGAKNLHEGDMVPVALVGAVLPGNKTITQSTIRGVASDGMLCSGRELQIGDDHEGILQLPKTHPLGESLSRLLGHDSKVLDIELTTNRGDCLSVLGCAREVAPLLHTKVREPKKEAVSESTHKTSSVIRLDVTDPAACIRYAAMVMDSVKIAESPDWIQQRLLAAGLSPINNVVDVTNFVMWEYGQPLHAFDLRKVESGSIAVRAVAEPFSFALLNGATVQLEPGDICIYDGDRPIALAGIMGGAGSQITPDTTSLLLESAAFPSGQITKTARRLGLLTEAARRYMHGIDYDNVVVALERACGLLRDTACANVYFPALDHYPGKGEPLSLALDMREARQLTGLTHLSTEQAQEALESIGMHPQRKSANVLTVPVPSFRNDIRASVDLVEEVARIVGFDSLPETLPVSSAAFHRLNESGVEFDHKLKRLFVGLGFREIMSYSFLSQNWLRECGFASQRVVTLKRPLSEEMKVLRPSLLPSLLATYGYNRNRQAKQQRLFECATTFEWKNEAQNSEVLETQRVAGLLSGDTLPHSWSKRNVGEVDYYLAKGIVERILRQLTTVFAQVRLTKHSFFHPRRATSVHLGLREVGVVGMVHPRLLQEWENQAEPVAVFELNLDILKKYMRTLVRYQTPSKYPTTGIDLAFWVSESHEVQPILESIQVAGQPYLKYAELFDIFFSKGAAGEDLKSIAVHLVFGASDRTLLDADVATAQQAIVEVLTQKYAATLRSAPSPKVDASDIPLN